jgi:hypothetical protein
MGVCVVCCKVKDKRQSQNNQDKEVVQMKYREGEKKIPPGAWLSVSCECCVFVRYRSLRRVDPSSRGVLPTVVCHCVWYTSRMRRLKPASGL